ncbi:hypothetical protein K5D38_13370 [Pseudomonas cichorii]|nr:hypothetical protein [Pseudomonas cichorii]
MLDSLSADFSNGGLYQKFFESEAVPGLGVWLEAHVQINPGVLAAAVFRARSLFSCRGQARSYRYAFIFLGCVKLLVFRE